MNCAKIIVAKYPVALAGTIPPAQRIVIFRVGERSHGSGWTRIGNKSIITQVGAITKSIQRQP